MRVATFPGRGGGRRLILGAVLVAMLAGALGRPARAETEEERVEDLQDLYQCTVTAFLAAIHRPPMDVPQNRFLILSTRRRPEAYVQCAFDDNDRQLICEAASGYFHHGIEGFVTAAQHARLVELGFSDVSDDNFRQFIPVDGIDSLYEVAGMLIETLARIYDLQESDALEANAPLVPERPAADVPGSRDCPALLSRL